MISGMNHVGISVADLDRSIEFYRNILGMEVVAQAEFAGEAYERVLGLTGVTGKAALLRLNSMQLELFQFNHPIPQQADPNRPVSDHGITHFCIQVTDIHSEHLRLAAAGVRFHCAPQVFFGGALATYGRDPDGNVFELLDTGKAA